MTVKEAELTFTQIEGEEEEKFLEKARIDMKERRSKSNNNRNRGGGPGRKHFTRKRKNDDAGEHRDKRAKAGRN